MRRTRKSKKSRYFSGWMLLVLSLMLNGSTMSHCSEKPFFSEAEKRQYPFIQWDKNRLTLPAHGGLDSVFRMIHALSESAQAPGVKLIHLGDSHLQADFFGNRFRKLINTYFQLNCPSIQNFIFPYNLARTNGGTAGQFSSKETDFTASRNSYPLSMLETDADSNTFFGLSGYYLQPPHPQTQIQINFPSTDSYHYNIHQIFAFHRFENTTSLPRMSSSKGLPCQSQHFQEDGVSIFDFDGFDSCFTYHFSELPDLSLPTSALHGFWIQNLGNTLSYNSIGVNGACVSHFLHSKYLSRELRILSPEVVILSFGTNDSYTRFDSAQFKTDYLLLIEKIRQASQPLAIILCTPGDYATTQEGEVPPLETIRKCIEEVALQSGCGLWDFYTVSGGRKSMQEWFATGLAAKDRLHLLKKGYELQARLFFEAFYSAYSTNTSN